VKKTHEKLPNLTPRLTPEAIQCLEEGLEDSLQFFHFDFIDHRRISSTNCTRKTQQGGEAKE
jgi:hypothetical protein